MESLHSQNPVLELQTFVVVVDLLPSLSKIPQFVGANAFLVLFGPTIAGAAEGAPVEVFTDPAILKQTIGALVVGVAWIIPYLIFNLIIAPKLGMIVEDPVTEAKNKNRDFF